MPEIDEIIKREGPKTNNLNDKGGRTEFGISEKANPEAWADGKVTEEEAREIYLKKYVSGPKFDQISDPKLQAQLVDWGVTSGPMIAIMNLQAILGVEKDGVIGPETLGAIQSGPNNLSNQLAISRVKMIAKIVQRDPSQAEFLGGWVNRACEFIS